MQQLLRISSLVYELCPYGFLSLLYEEKKIGGEGLTAQALNIGFCARFNGCTKAIGESRSVAMYPANLYKLVQELEELKLVRKKGHVFSITDKGINYLQSITSAITEFTKELDAQNDVTKKNFEDSEVN